MKFTIRRKDIRGMLHLAAKKDIRYYLQGINVVRDNRGTYIEATDGHILGRLFINGIQSDAPINVVLPTEHLIKLKGTKKQGDDFLHFSVEGHAVECISDNPTVRFQAHDARFPDTDRVIPMVFKDEDIKPATFNPDLLVRFVDFSEEIWGKRQIPSLIQRGDQSILVSFPLMDDHFVGVMMPCRDGGMAKVPDWCYRSKTKPVEAEMPVVVTE
jgi:DNA polymerase III subunit beta